MPKLLESCDQEQLQRPESVYVSSGELAGQAGDRWGQKPVALLTLRVEEATIRAMEALVSSASQSVAPEEILLEELDAWRDAAADAFWMIEDSLGEPDELE